MTGTRYTLDNLPALKTCVAKLKAAVPPGNVLTTLAGDFLAPSLLSSIDNGRGMVRASNRANPRMEPTPDQQTAGCRCQLIVTTAYPPPSQPRWTA